MRAIRPDVVREDKVANFKSEAATIEREFKWLRPDRPAGFGWMTQDLHPSGACGDATQASADKGAALLQHAASRLVQLLDEVARQPLPADVLPGG